MELCICVEKNNFPDIIFVPSELCRSGFSTRHFRARIFQNSPTALRPLGEYVNRNASAFALCSRFFDHFSWGAWQRIVIDDPLIPWMNLLCPVTHGFLLSVNVSANRTVRSSTSRRSHTHTLTLTKPIVGLTKSHGIILSKFISVLHISRHLHFYQ